MRRSAVLGFLAAMLLSARPAAAAEAAWRGAIFTAEAAESRGGQQPLFLQQGQRPLSLPSSALSASSAVNSGAEPPPERLVRFLAIADPHFRDRTKYPQGLDGFRDFLEKTKTLGADFVAVLGDVCGEDPPALAQAKKIADQSGVKVHFAAGNHDDRDGNAPEQFQAAFGELFYSFDLRGVHLIVHWSQKPQEKWLAADLAGAPAGAPVVFLQHYPVSSRLQKIFEKRSPVLSLSGHVHGYRSGMVGPRRDCTLDTFGAGFAVADVLPGGKTRVEWRPRGLARQLAVVYPPDGGEAPTGPATVLVNAFDSAREVARVELNAGGGWQPMERKTLWSWTARAELRGGELQVRALDSAGETWTASSKYRAGGAAPAVRTGADWPVAGGTPDNRRAAADALAPPLALAWRAELGGRPQQPVLAGGRLYVTVSSQDFEENDALVCLEAAGGRELWRARLEGSPLCPAAVTAGVAAAIDRHGRAWGFDAAGGERRWRVEGLEGNFSTYGLSGQLTAAEGVFYTGNLYALAAATGRQLWKSPIAQYPSAPPAVAGGKLVGAGTGCKMCLDVRDGKELWRRITSSSRASVVLGETALVGGFQVLNLADGKPVRPVACPSGGADGAVSPDGKLLVAGSDKGSLIAAGLDDGKVRWSFPPRGGKLSFSGAAISGRHVWFAAGDGLVRAVNLADGKESWSFRLGCRGTAPIVGGNALFIAGEDGCVYALAAGK